MPFAFLRSIPRCTARVTRTARLSPSAFSTQRPSYEPLYQSKPFLAATIFLGVGVPIGFALGSHTHVPESQAKTQLGDLYEGSLNWRGKTVPPFTPDDVNAWLLKEQSLHKGP